MVYQTNPPLILSVRPNQKPHQLQQKELSSIQRLRQAGRKRGWCKTLFPFLVVYFCRVDIPVIRGNVVNSDKFISTTILSYNVPHVFVA